MYDINNMDLTGTFKTNQVSNLPQTIVDFDMVRIYAIEKDIQQCELFDSKHSGIKIYRRVKFVENTYSEWMEVVTLQPNNKIDKLDMVEYLIQEIRKEQEYVKDYELEEIKAREQYEQDVEKGVADKYYYSSKYFKYYYDKTPSKQKIKDNIKMARRLLMEIASEVKWYE